MIMDAETQAKRLKIIQELEKAGLFLAVADERLARLQKSDPHSAIGMQQRQVYIAEQTVIAATRQFNSIDWATGAEEAWKKENT